MPAPQGQSFFVVPCNPADMGGLEFSRYAELVAQRMQAQGYARAPSVNQATMVVQVGYGVDDGHDRRSSATPFYGGYRLRRLGYGAIAGYYGRRSLLLGLGRSLLVRRLSAADRSAATPFT